MNNELLTPHEAAKVPSIDVARWLARLDLIELALNENTQVCFGGSFSDDGIIGWSLAERAVAGQDWQHDKDYESVMIYELKRGLSYDAVQKATEPFLEASETSIPEQKADKIYKMSRLIGKTVLREGLDRMGFFQIYTGPNEFSLLARPVAAALHYRRGDIHSPIDRKLFTRAGAIEMAEETISKAVKPRYMRYMSTDYKKQPIARIGSVYREIAWPAETRELTEKLGLNPDAALSPWWQELQQDLARIDAFAASLNKHPVATRR